MNAGPPPGGRPPGNANANANASANAKKSSGLGIFLAILGGGFVLLMLVVGIGAYLVWSNPQGRAFVGMMGEAVRITQRAQKAPGTKELRALGCKHAMVLEVDDLVNLAKSVDGAANPRPTAFGSLVSCALGPFGTPPPCDDVAKTYVGAVGPRPKSFIVSVTKTGTTKAVCQSLYDGAGVRQSGAPGDDTFVPPTPDSPTPDEP